MVLPAGERWIYNGGATALLGMGTVRYLWRVVLDGRITISQFAGIFHFDGDAGKLLNQVFPHKRRVPTGAASRQHNAVDRAKLLRRKVQAAEHGGRRVCRIASDGSRSTLADRYQGMRLNSPNDIVVKSDGSVYFTDPPFGLAGVQKSPLRELTYTGVFRVTPDNQVQLIADNLFPNGIALSPDNRVLYATDNSGWVAIDLDALGDGIHAVSLDVCVETMRQTGRDRNRARHAELGPGGGLFRADVLRPECPGIRRAHPRRTGRGERRRRDPVRPSRRARAPGGEGGDGGALRSGQPRADQGDP